VYSVGMDEGWSREWRRYVVMDRDSWQREREDDRFEIRKRS
jgi:hypothetical protein